MWPRFDSCAGFAFNFFAFVVYLGISFLTAASNKKAQIFNALATTIVASSALCYLIEALGTTEMAANNDRGLLWLRYAQWAFNTPLLIAITGLLAGTTAFELVYTSLLALVTTGALFAAALSRGFNATWPIYVLGLVVALPIFAQTWFVWAARANKLGAATRSAFYTIASLGSILAIGYAVNWGTAEGGQHQTVDQEAITYVVLDIFTRVVLTFIVLFFPSAIDGAGAFDETVEVKVTESV